MVPHRLRKEKSRLNHLNLRRLESYEHEDFDLALTTQRSPKPVDDRTGKDVTVMQQPEATVIEQFIENILETRFERFDVALLGHAKNRIIDTVGCAIAGANAPGCPELCALIKDWGGKEEATILGHGGRAPAQNVAMINSIMARSFDGEPNTVLIDGLFKPAHISGTSVMTVTAVGEMVGANGKEIITAMLVGEDLASRISAAASSNRRQDAVGMANVFGAAAIAGRLLGLNRIQMRNALGLCLNQMSGSHQNVWDRTYAFKLSQGLSSRSGVFSAQLAKSGWTAAEDALFGRFAYFYQYFDGVANVDILTKDLGKKYHGDVQFKSFPSGRYHHGAIECALALARKVDIAVEAINEVIVHLSGNVQDSAVALPFGIDDPTYSSALFSFQYAVASALIRKGVKSEYFLEDYARDPQVHALMNRIRLAVLTGSGPLAARVDVIMSDGTEYSQFVEAPKGDQDVNPMSKDEIVAKFWTNVEFSKMVSEKNAGEALRYLDEFEEIDNLGRVIGLLSVDR